MLGVLWWSWVGYSWLTSVVDPEEGLVRFAIFGAMAALLVVAICVPQAFGELGLLFACAYMVVRIGQIVLLYSASRGDPGMRRSVIGLAIGTLIGTSILIGASFTDRTLQGGLWALALALDVGEPYVFGSEGWKLAPRHFVERHGLIIIIALGESIVSIGAGVEGDVDAGVVAAAALGVGVAAALWWLYFDIVALVAERRLVQGDPGVSRTRSRATRSRTSTSQWSPASCWWHSGSRRRSGTSRIRSRSRWRRRCSAARRPICSHTWRFAGAGSATSSAQRLICALALVALIPLATEIASLATVTIVLGILSV